MILDSLVNINAVDPASGQHVAGLLALKDNLYNISTAYKFCGVSYPISKIYSTREGHAKCNP